MEENLFNDLTAQTNFESFVTYYIYHNDYVNSEDGLMF